MAKPVGPACNLDCSYCFYLHKQDLLSTESRWRMSDAVLEAFLEFEHADQVLREGVAGPIGAVHPRQGGEGVAEVLHWVTRSAGRLLIFYIEHTFDTITT